MLRAMQDEDIAFLMEDHGTDLTLTRAGPGGTYDPATGAITYPTPGTGDPDPSVPLTYTIRGVFINYEEERINNTTIKADDRKLLIQALGIPVVPRIGDVAGGMTLIGPVRTIKSGDTVLAYTAQTRA